MLLITNNNNNDSILELNTSNKKQYLRNVFLNIIFQSEFHPFYRLKN